MNISFLTTGHFPYDDRVFYHTAKNLVSNKDRVEIISSKIDLNTDTEAIHINSFEGDKLSKKDKVFEFVKKLQVFKPDVIVCSEPLAIYAANKYKKLKSKTVKIVYDVTEWYPSKKNLKNLNLFYKCFQFIKLLLFNIYTSFMVDAFIFGEHYKSIPYRLLFPLKKYEFISYYPDLKYLSIVQPDLQTNKLKLSYSGTLSEEKGFGCFLNVLKEISRLNKDLSVKVKVIGNYESKKEEERYKASVLSLSKNVSIAFYDSQNFKDYIKLINDTDVFLDLRSTGIENQHCLPIKLFYYAALKRPVLFSNLKSIRKEVEINRFGSLVKPNNTKDVAIKLLNYISNQDLYYKHCENAHELSINKYNWDKIKPGFIKFFSDLELDAI